MAEDVTWEDVSSFFPPFQELFLLNLTFELFIGTFFFMLDTHAPLQKKSVYKILVLITLPQTEFALRGYINNLLK